MKTTLYILLFALFLSGCGCTKWNSTYADRSTDKTLLMPVGAFITYEDSLGNQSTITFTEYDCSWSGYEEQYPDEDCYYVRSEECVQGSIMNSGDARLSYSVSSFAKEGLFIKIENIRLHLQFHDDSGYYEGIGDYVVRDSTYNLVRKFISYDTTDTNIKYVYFNKENKIIQIRFSDGSLWDQVPN
jgi:hypothetical protein